MLDPSPSQRLAESGACAGKKKEAPRVVPMTRTTLGAPGMDRLDTLALLSKRRDAALLSSMLIYSGSIHDLPYKSPQSLPMSDALGHHFTSERVLFCQASLQPFNL